MVRGMKVRFDWIAINSLYRLAVVDVNAYEDNVQNLDHVAVSDFLWPTSTQWKYDQGQCLSFPKGHMSSIGKVWLFFVGARNLPTTHYNDVTKERAHMVYTILNVGLFDVGQHIADEILKLAFGRHGGTRGGLWFPSLITQLCRRAGVAMASNEMTCAPKGAIDKSLILRITAAHFPPPHRRNVRPPPVRRVPSPVATATDMDDDVELLLQCQTEMLYYVHGGFTMMDAMLRDMADHFHVDIRRHELPLHPDWSTPPRSVGEEDDDDDDDDDDEDDEVAADDEGAGHDRDADE